MAVHIAIVLSYGDNQGNVASVEAATLASEVLAIQSRKDQRIIAPTGPEGIFPEKRVGDIVSLIERLNLSARLQKSTDIA